MNRPTPVAFSLIGISVVLFVVPRVAPGLADPTVRWARDLIEQYAAQANWLVADGEWWRVLTAAFLHGSSTHLLFNMWALYIFGPELERQVGSLTFATLYLGVELLLSFLNYDMATIPRDPIHGRLRMPGQ